MDFYCVKYDVQPRYYNAAPDPYPDDWDVFLRSSTNPVSVVRYEIDCGRHPGDVLSTAAWSERMVNALKSHKMTGISSYPIEVYRKGKSLSGYVGIRVLGRGGPFDEIRSGAERVGRALFGHEAVYMSEREWDGSDVFTIPGLGTTIFVSTRAAAVLKDVGLTNVTLVLNSECRFGVGGGR